MFLQVETKLNGVSCTFLRVCGYMSERDRNTERERDRKREKTFVVSFLGLIKQMCVLKLCLSFHRRKQTKSTK